MRALRLALAAAAFARGRLAVALWTLIASIRLRAAGARVGRGLRVRGPIRLHCHRTAVVTIGDRCRIQSGFAGNPVGDGARMAIWVGPRGRLTLGDDVGLSNSTIVCLESVTIENEVFLGGGSRIYDTDFHSLDASERARPRNPGARTAPVTIRRRTFIGGHSILLKGVTVGEAAVVGAGSVVRADVPDGEIWAGNPARVVRRVKSAAAPRVPARVAAGARARA